MIPIVHTHISVSISNHIVSPPSRRGRDRDAGGGGDAFDTANQQSGGPAFPRTDENRPRRGRKFDRHSGTGFVYGIIATHSFIHHHHSMTTAVNENNQYIGIVKRRSIKVGDMLKPLKKMRMYFLLKY